MSEPIPTYHDCLIDLGAQLAERGSLGLIMIDATSLGAIELEYGGDAYAEVRQRMFKLLGEQKGKDYRLGDVLCLDEPGGLRFLLFLERKRRRNLPVTSADLKSVRNRLASSLAPSLARTSFPYFKSPPRIHLGHGLALHNSLVGPKRLL